MKLTYAEAINKCLLQEMERDPNVFVYGISINSHSKVFGTTADLLEQFGPLRCFETPVCEDSMVGLGLGAAVCGLRPVNIHIRIDFLLLAMNQLVNMVSTFHYSTQGKTKVPFVIRVLVGRGWGQGYQHSKSLHSYFAHIPGLQVILPTTPYDVKGILASAIRGNNPTVIIEHRWLYFAKDDVPEESYMIPIASPWVRRKGKDFTVLATSWMVVEALKAAEVLEKKHGVHVEVIDARTIKPFYGNRVYDSVRKTRHCLVVDNDWVNCGFSAEVAARVSEVCFSDLKAPVKRLGWKDTPCPTIRVLENEFYSNAKDIVMSIEDTLKLDYADLSGEEFYSHEKQFKGPF